MLVFLWYIAALGVIFMAGCAYAAVPHCRDEWSDLREDYADRLVDDAADIAALHQDMCGPGESLYLLSVWCRECATTRQAIYEWLVLRLRCRRQQARIALVAFIDRYALARPREGLR